MSPEELAAYREWIRISKFASNSWPCMALDQWKTENQTLKSQISDLEKRNADLEARVAALKEIAGEERAAVLACFEDAHGVTEEHRLEARRQLVKEHPEAFR